MFLDSAVFKLRLLATLVALDAVENQSRGDLEGAWEDIRLLIVIAGHLETTPILRQVMVALVIHRQAMELGMRWTADPAQTSERLRDALADLQTSPPVPSLGEAILVELALLERTLDLPAEDLLDLAGSHGLTRSTLGRMGAGLIFTPPWERERASRVARMLAVLQIETNGLEPHERDMGPARIAPANRSKSGPATPTLSEHEQLVLVLLESSPLARLLTPNFEAARISVEWQVMERRALEQILALRAWQWEHDGEYPETLAELVPSLLDELPRDPFSGHPFRYAWSGGQSLIPRGRQADGLDFSLRNAVRPTRPGQRLLYSVGPDRVDDRAVASYRQPSGPVQGDIVFPLPDAPAD